MDAPEHFEIMTEGYACYRPEGEVSLEEGVGLIARAITYSGEQQIRQLLIDTTRLTGYRLPDTMDRFGMGVEMAGAQKAPVKVVLVAKPELIDPQRFGVTVARNRGLFGNVFGSEAEARAWLLDPNAR